MKIEINGNLDNPMEAKVGLVGQAKDIQWSLVSIPNCKEEDNWKMVLVDTSRFRIRNGLGQIEVRLTAEQAGAIVALFIAGEFNSATLNNALCEVAEAALGNVPWNLHPILRPRALACAKQKEKQVMQTTVHIDRTAGTVTVVLPLAPKPSSTGKSILLASTPAVPPTTTKYQGKVVRVLCYVIISKR